MEGNEPSCRNESTYRVVALTASLVAILGSIASTAIVCLGGVLAILSWQEDATLWTIGFFAAFALTGTALVVQSALPDEFVRSAGLLFIGALLALPVLAASWIYGIVLAFGFDSIAGIARGIAGIALILVPIACVIIASSQLTIFTERARSDQVIAVSLVIGCSALMLVSAILVLALIPVH